MLRRIDRSQFVDIILLPFALKAEAYLQTYPFPLGGSVTEVHYETRENLQKCGGCVGELASALSFAC
jgi:hypothetical protein